MMTVSTTTRMPMASLIMRSQIYLMKRSRMGAGYARLANCINDEDGNNDEDDESVIDNDEEDELDAELENARTIKTSSF